MRMSVSNKIGIFAYCPSHVQFFKNKNAWYNRGITPKKGDIIFFTQGDDAAHVGIVEYSQNGYVFTIEGNTSGANGLVTNGGGVARKSYNIYSNYILGYGRPEYTGNEASTVVSIAVSQIGYLEKKTNAYLDSFTENAGYNNYTKYSRDVFPSVQGQPWCDVFVSWCGYMADNNNTPKKEVLFKPMKTYKNGSTEELVYKDTDFSTKTGSLDPYENCYCIGIYGNAYLVCYRINGYNDRWAVGYVKYNGGITD